MKDQQKKKQKKNKKKNFIYQLMPASSHNSQND